MRRFFYNQINVLKVGETLPVTEDIFHHWCKVLRATVGETAIFFDGQGGEYTVTLTDIGKKTAVVTVENFDPINRDLPYQVHIGLVMSRGERMDYAIQKATEMGVTAIHLLTSERCEVRLKPDQIAKKLEHWQGVAISACEQCGLNIVPQIILPMSLSDWVTGDFFTNVDLTAKLSDNATTTAKTEQNWLKLVLAVPEQSNDTTAWQRIAQTFDSQNMENIGFGLLIGCEGGLSADEIALAEQHNFLRWQIGERVLRTETAPVVALATLHAMWTYHQCLT